MAKANEANNASEPNAEFVLAGVETCSTVLIPAPPSCV